MPGKIWRSHPLHSVIVEIMQRKGPTSDVDLYNLVKDAYGDIGFDSFNKELMRLEIAGLIYVSALTKGKRRVELLEKEQA